MSKQELADLAFQAENYNKAYNYYSQIVETDINDVEAWIGMGLCAGYLSSYEKHSFAEAETCLNKAQTLGIIDKGLLQKIAHHIPKIAEEYFDTLTKGINQAMTEEGKKAMATGQFHGVRVIELETKRLALNLDNYSNYTDALAFSESAYTYEQSIEVVKAILQSIDKLLMQAKPLPDELKNEIKAKRRNWIEKGRKVDPSFNPREFSTHSSEGCFIATACYDSYHAPEVIILRRFRDEYLSQIKGGRDFIKFYYKISPKCARFLTRKPFLKRVVKILVVQPCVAISNKFINSD